VQRGGLSNQTPSRPSNSASVPATTPSSNTQPSSSSSSSLVHGDDIPDIPVSEADVSKVEAHFSAVAGASEIEPVVGQNEENLVKQVQHALVLGNKADATELDQSGSGSGTPAGNFDEEGQVKSSDAVRKDRSPEELPRSSESSSRPLSGRLFSAQSASSAGQKAPSVNLSHLSPSSMPLPVSTSYPPQPVSHAPPPVSPPSVHTQLAVSSETLPVSRTHEENDPGRLPSSSDSVGCSHAPIPQAPPAPSTPASSRRSGWVGCSALNSNRGPTQRRFSVALKARSSPNSSRPTSPRSYGEGDGYNSADEQSPWTAGPSGYKDGVSP
jgi:hypothetical protein